MTCFARLRSASSKSSAASIPELGRIVGFRDVLVHDYDDVADDIVWGVVKGNLDDLRATLSRLLAEFGEPKG
jgi:uncharacterized protein with HEPN domain